MKKIIATSTTTPIRTLVHYGAGEGTRPDTCGKGVDYMAASVLVEGDDEDDEWDVIDLYAEVIPVMYDENGEEISVDDPRWDDECGYKDVKAAFIEAAKEKGIDPAALLFWQDEPSPEEKLLEGGPIGWAEVVNLMDDGIREELNQLFEKYCPWGYDEDMEKPAFLALYLERHKEKFGENFTI